MRRALAALCVLAALGARADADADGGAAKELYDRGVAAYQAKDYPAAVTAFHDAYDLEPRPEILFAWAQAERLGGDCAHAIVLYRKFLDGHPPSVQAQAAQGPLERCERALASVTPAPAPPAELAAEPAPAASSPPTTAPRPDARRRFYQDTVGDVLVGGGVAAAIAGVVLLATAGSPDGATTYDEFQMRHDSAVSHQRWGAVALGVGAALVAGGVTHWVFWTRGGETGVAVAGRF